MSYAALNFSDTRTTRGRKKRDLEKDTVYTGVKYSVRWRLWDSTSDNCFPTTNMIIQFYVYNECNGIIIPLVPMVYDVDNNYAGSTLLFKTSCMFDTSKSKPLKKGICIISCAPWKLSGPHMCHIEPWLKHICTSPMTELINTIHS